MYHCNEHGIDHRQFDCPRCVAQRQHDEVLDALNAQAEAQAEAAEAQADALVEAEKKRLNPGEHTCPHCLYSTLRRYASRCPFCQGTIDSGHWVRVAEAEAEAAQRRKEEEELRRKEWERTRPEREREAARKEAEKEREAARTLSRELFGWLLILCGVSIVLFAPYLSVWTTGILIEPWSTPAPYAVTTPVINHIYWWFLFVHYYGTSTGTCLFWSAVCWTLCGVATSAYGSKIHGFKIHD